MRAFIAQRCADVNGCHGQGAERIAANSTTSRRWWLGSCPHLGSSRRPFRDGRPASGMRCPHRSPPAGDSTRTSMCHASVARRVPYGRHAAWLTSSCSCRLSRHGRDLAKGGVAARLLPSTGATWRGRAPRTSGRNGRLGHLHRAGALFAFSPSAPICTTDFADPAPGLSGSAPLASNSPHSARSGLAAAPLTRSPSPVWMLATACPATEFPMSSQLHPPSAPDRRTCLRLRVLQLTTLAGVDAPAPTGGRWPRRRPSW